MIKYLNIPIAIIIALLFSSCGPTDKHYDIPYLEKSDLKHIKWSEISDNPNVIGLYTVFKGMRINNQNLYYERISTSSAKIPYTFYNSKGDLIKQIELPWFKERKVNFTKKINFANQILLDVEQSETSYESKDLLDFNKGIVGSVDYIIKQNNYNWTKTDILQHPLIVMEDVDSIPEHIMTKYRNVGFSPIVLQSPYEGRETNDEDRSFRNYSDSAYMVKYHAYHEKLRILDSINAPKIKAYYEEIARRYKENINAIVENNKGNIYKYIRDDDTCLVVSNHGIAFVKTEDIDASDFPDYEKDMPNMEPNVVDGYKLENFDSSTGYSASGGKLGSFNSINYYHLIHNTDTIKFKSNNVCKLWDVVPKNKNNKTTFVLNINYNEFLFMEYDYNKPKDNIN